MKRMLCIEKNMVKNDYFFFACCFFLGRVLPWVPLHIFPFLLLLSPLPMPFLLSS